MSFADYMRRSGWGRDEAGDAARRAALDGSYYNGDQLREAHARGLIDSPSLRRALTAEADRIVAEARRLGADGVVPADPDPVPGHQLTQERTPAGNIVARCECGRWDGGWTGPRSRRRILDDYATHVAAELAATGPIRVQAERLDLPKELES